MGSKEEAKELYEGKYFYELIKSKLDGKNVIILQGPFDNIYYTSINHPKHTKYKFMQVIDGVPVAAFEEHEILVTDRKL